MEPEVTDFDIERSSRRLSKVCRLSSLALTVVACFFMVPLLLSPVILVGAALAAGPFSYTGSPGALALMLAQSALLSASLWLIRTAFVDIYKRRPFYAGQSRHLLVAGILMLACTFVEVIPYDLASLSLHLGPLSVGLVLEREASAPINVGTLLCSISLLTMSAVFRHGYLLRCVSDDTV